MINYLKGYGWLIYLGVCCSHLGINVFSWKYWVIIIPTIFLVEWKVYK